MFNAWVNFVRSYLIEGIFDLFSLVELLLVSQFPQAFSIEDALDLAEDKLDGIVIRAVSEVKDRNNIQTFVCGHRLSSLMNTKIIHEDGKWFTTVDVTKPI